MTKHDFHKAGYEDGGIEICDKCHQQVEVMVSPTGNKVFLNLPNHIDRPGWIHSLGCGRNPEEEFQKEYPQKT